MFCKGYSGGDVNNETYGDLDFFIGLKQLLEDCGLQDVPEFNNNKVNFKLLKAIFSMDSYVLINKGTRIPDNIIIASKSLCNKDYSNVPAFSVLAGMPAKVVASDRQRIW